MFEKQGYHLICLAALLAGVYAVLKPDMLEGVFLGLAIANRSTLPLDPALVTFLAVLLFLPSAYLFFSVVRYFGYPRALGIDHFDESYRTKPFVRAGIFKYTTNGMYTFGFLFLWIPGLAFFSQAALLSALFSHLYIWVHYYCTELPDIRRIYGTGPPA